MNRPLVAVVRLSRLSVPEKIVLGSSIDHALTTYSGVFRTPTPSQADLAAGTLELTLAADDAATGSRTGKQRLKKAETAYNGLVRQYVGYVNQIAQGDALLIEQSACSVSRTAHRAEPLGAPAGGKLKGLNPCELQVAFPALAGARAYVWQIYVGPTAPTAETDWQHLTGTTQPRRLLTGLPSGSRVWVRCAAIGTRGQSPWSDAISRIVL